MSKFLAAGLVTLAALLGLLYVTVVQPEREVSVSSYEECIARGYTLMESYPAVCKTPRGQTFVQDIGNEFQVADKIRLDAPRPGARIASPVVIRGRARGTWYFEASFPVTLLGEDGRVLAQAPAQAQGEWMTEEFVPFELYLTFEPPTGTTGTLLLEKDNPSGLPEYAEHLRVPIRFSP